MAYQFPSDLQEFVGEQMESGQYMSEDDLLRDAFRALSEEREDLAAVREALAELDAGDLGTPLEAAFATVRSRHQLDEPT